MNSEESGPPGFLHPRAITVAVDPINLVVTECITVTSAMRKHARWAHSSVSAILGAYPETGRRESKVSKEVQASRGPGHDQASEVMPVSGLGEGALAGRWGLRGKKGKSMQDNPLMAAFTRLRCELKGLTSRTPGYRD